jgi:hypothetical protein
MCYECQKAGFTPIKLFQLEMAEYGWKIHKCHSLFFFYLSQPYTCYRTIRFNKPLYFQIISFQYQIMDKTPSEILCKVFIQLDFKERLKCMLVYRNWRIILDKHTLFCSIKIER